MNLNNIFKDRIKAHIVTFFHENPQSVDTPRGVATWINQPRNVVKRALEELAQEGILIPHRVSSTTGYAYTQNRKLILMVEKFLKTKGKK